MSNNLTNLTNLTNLPDLSVNGNDTNLPVNGTMNEKYILFSFDFDGTITDVPGENSELFLESKCISKMPLLDVYNYLKNVYQRYMDENVCKQLQVFFTTIKLIPNCIITIQTNNYRNVVEACLLYHIKIPLEYIDYSRSCFRECNKPKYMILNQLAKLDEIDRIYYFEDTLRYILCIKNREKVKCINCENGTKSIRKLLDITPVTNVDSLIEFLKYHST
jgi:hypothetical protein